MSPRRCKRAATRRIRCRRIIIIIGAGGDKLSSIVLDADNLSLTESTQHTFIMRNRSRRQCPVPTSSCLHTHCLPRPYLRVNGMRFVNQMLQKHHPIYNKHIGTVEAYTNVPLKSIRMKYDPAAHYNLSSTGG